MRRVRALHVLLIKNRGLVNRVRFKSLTYVGGPINVVMILNDKEIDEIVILGIDATKEKRGPNIKLIKEIAGEAFIPLVYQTVVNEKLEVDAYSTKP